MDLLSLKPDADLKKNGAEVEIYPGAWITVRPAGDHAYQTRIGMLRRPHERTLRLLEEVIEARTATEEQRAEHERLLLPIVARAAGERLVTGWRGFTEGGVEVPYSPEKFAEYWAESEDFRTRVAMAASEEGNFRRKRVEDAVGNSPAASNGNSGSVRGSKTSPPLATT